MASGARVRDRSKWASGRATLPAVVVCAALQLTAAAHAQVVPLAQLEQSALSGRAEVDAGRARVTGANAQLDKAHTGYMPIVTAGANASLAPGRRLVTIPGTDTLVSGSRALGESGAFTPQPRYGATIGLHGSLYDFGRTRSAVDAASAEQRAAQAEALAHTEQIVREVRGAYVRWAGAFALWQLAQQGVELADAREKRVAALIEEGARPAVDRTTAAQQTAAAKIDAERAAEQLEAARLELAYVSAYTLGAEAQPDPSLLSAANEPPPSAADDSSGKGEQALESARAAAEARARMQEHQHAPVLGYDADTGLQGQTSHLFPVYSAGVSLTVPLFDGGASSADAAQARAQAAELSAQAAAERARRQYGAARVRAASTHAARRLALASDALRLAQAQMEQLQGTGGLDTDSVQALAEAEGARARAQSEVVLAQIAAAQARLGLLEP